MKYDAFISYRHSELDMEIAKKVHSGLEGFRIPGPIQQKYGKKRINRVFRDQEELPIGSDLNDNISSALRESEYLVVICSPRTPGSYWVCREIETFIRMHDRQHVLAVLIEGEPNESFPQALLVNEKGESVEPLAADVRGATAKERKNKLKTELIRLAAPLIGCTYDDLKQRHRERVLKKTFGAICVATSLIALLGVGFSIYNATMAAKIEKNYKIAMENQYKYMADIALGLAEDGYREDAIIVASEALADEGAKMPYVPQAEYALSSALYTYSIGHTVEKDGMLEHDVSVNQLEFDYDKCHLLTVDSNQKVYVWDVANGNQLIAEINMVESILGSRVEVFQAQHVGEEIVVSTDVGVYGYSLEGEQNWQVEQAGCLHGMVDAASQMAILQTQSQLVVVDLASHNVAATFEVPDSMACFGNGLTYDASTGNLYTSYSTMDQLGYLFVANTDTMQTAAYPMIEDYIRLIAFDDKGYVYVLSYASDEAIESLTKPYTGYIQKINVTTGEQVWCYNTELSEGGATTASSAILKYRSYVLEGENAEYEEIVLGSNTLIVSLNATTGEETVHLTMGGAVRSILLSQSSALGYAAISTGRVNVMNFTDGTIYNDLVIDTGLPITDLKITGGFFAIKSYVSPDVLVMKYHEGENVEEVFNTDLPVERMQESPDGKWIAIETGYPDGEILYLLPNDSQGFDVSEIQSVDLAAAGFDFVATLCFTANNQIFIYNADGKATLLDPSTLTRQDIAVDANWGSGEAVVNYGASYAVVVDNDQLLVLDLIRGEQTAKIKLSGTAVDEAVVTENGKMVYYVDENSVFYWDTDENESKVFSEDLSQICRDNGYYQILTISQDGNQLAVACKDGMVRVFDTNKKQLCTEMEYMSFSNSNMYYILDGEYLLLQGDDYYIHIYDTKTWESVYTSDAQYRPIKQIVERTDIDRCAMILRGCTVVLDTQSFLPVADIEYGNLLTKDGKVLMNYQKQIYAAPYQTISSLKEAAQKQLNGRTLSEEKKIKYHMNSYE